MPYEINETIENDLISCAKRAVECLTAIVDGTKISDHFTDIESVIVGLDNAIQQEKEKC